ncbi:PREDICTED: protein IQ-DOMAIN 31-like [Tarenaya hassleriana]|uniref:protein IQ-DOMAIN 31-like n=1 Tax=Tarenaya hassleriana TaxID=28532 RepID=UPI00053C3742|nr:PREDICTED: protein IQ-DOMAIN 31-like [Tarenaya hassleriana]XP_010523450.1 PREDICTED: protein IQ-DOMAIN 31-like [Tarenaya hassleriana]
MGKTPSPSKWFKNLIGRKSSKSSLAKENEKLKSAKKEKLAVSVKDDVKYLPVEPLIVSAPVPTDTARTVAEKNPSDGTNVSSVKDNEVGESNIDPGLQNDSGELKQEQAATKVQAAFRAHQARRAFSTLKGIIRLQSVIRGHLVRRQAVATYSCIYGIVKLQALVRGQRARSPDNGIQLRKKFTEARNSETLQARSCSWMENPAKLSIVDKLLALSSTVLPLKLQYNHEDPNSAKVWLERWTRLQIWSPNSRATKNLILKPLTKKSMIEKKKGRPKRGIKKAMGPSTENGSSLSIAENEKKPKRNVRKASSLSKELPPRIENDKVKQSSRKTIGVGKDGSPLEVKEEKPSRPSFKKVSNTPLSNGPEKSARKSAEKKKDMADAELDGKASTSLSEVPETLEKKNDIPNAVSKDSDLDKNEKSEVMENPEQDELKAAESSDKAEEVRLLCSEHGNVDSENTKEVDRRASLPAKIENQDDGLKQSASKLPSYMAPTESAKARVRGHASPRFSQERIEKNGISRRHSLPSSTDEKMSTMSPRAHRLLLASGKGSMNGDRSFSSSKDVGDKSNRAEWKR